MPTADLAWPGGYLDQAELALIDAVLSIRARYGQPHNGVRGQVNRWRRYRGGAADELGVLAASDLRSVLTNRQRISGVLKVDAITQAAGALQARGITTAAAAELGRPARQLDHQVWQYMRTTPDRRR